MTPSPPHCLKMYRLHPCFMLRQKGCSTVVQDSSLVLKACHMVPAAAAAAVLHLAGEKGLHPSAYATQHITTVISISTLQCNSDLVPMFIGFRIQILGFRVFGV